MMNDTFDDLVKNYKMYFCRYKSGLLEFVKLLVELLKGNSL